MPRHLVLPSTTYTSRNQLGEAITEVNGGCTILLPLPSSTSLGTVAAGIRDISLPPGYRVVTTTNQYVSINQTPNTGTA